MFVAGGITGSAAREAGSPVAARGLLTKENSMHILLAGGGTGGHLMPGIALANAARAQGHEILFVTAGRPVEERILGDLPKLALPLERADGALSPFAMAARMPAAIAAARNVIKQFRPDVLLGLGGLASFPAAVAARMAGVPFACLEINAVPGRATAWLAPFAARIFVASDAGAAKYPKKALVTGMPLRAGFLAMPERAAARASFGLDRNRKTLLILGGSQGASGVNRAVVSILPDLEALGAQVLWIAGPGKDDRVREAIEGRPKLNISLHSYLDDAPRAFAAADLAICRSGAATVFELAAAGLPSIAIPYPYHRDRQQLRNAQLLNEGAMILEERDITRARLSGAVASILENDARAQAMSDAARRAARPTAHVAILSALAELARPRPAKNLHSFL